MTQGHVADYLLEAVINNEEVILPKVHEEVGMVPHGILQMALFDGMISLVCQRKDESLRVLLVIALGRRIPRHGGVASEYPSMI